MLTDQQITALTRPCLLGIECAHARYRRFIRGYSCILTINSGYE